MSEIVHQPFCNYYPCFSKGKQTGGAVYKMNNLEIDIREEPDSQDGTPIIYGGRQEGKRFCFLMTINNKKEATLQSLGKGDDCFISAGGTSRDLVKIAYQIAKEQGCNQLRLTDNSYIECPEKVQLADLTFLTTAKTWYQSILPFKPVKLQDYTKLSDRMRTITWGEVKKDFERKKARMPDTVDTVDDVPAMKVFAAMKESQGYCSFFADNMTGLLSACDVKSLYGTEWVVKIPQTKRHTIRAVKYKKSV